MSATSSTTVGQLKIAEVTEASRIEKVAALAREIWTEHYTPIIGEAQVEYMLKNFQTVEAIGRQIRDEGYLYYLLVDTENNDVGYLAAVPRTRESELFLSKIYVQKAKRGRGYALLAMRFLEELAAKTRMRKITLTVNRNNSDSVAAYNAMGFKKTRTQVTDIGGGFVMDDYVMEKELSNP